MSEAILADASGYILKHATPQHITDAIQGVLRGESPLNQELAMRLLRRVLDEAPKKKEERPADPAHARSFEERPATSLPEPLTAREVEVLRLIARGQTNQQISRSLLVSVSTVKKHVRHIVEKLEVSDRVQAAVRAAELGLLPMNGRDSGDPP